MATRYLDEVFFEPPVYDERVTILATIVHTKEDENKFTGEWEWSGLFLCESDIGRFKLWGRVPSKIQGAIDEMSDAGDERATVKGALVQFDARIVKPKGTGGLSFFNRPTKCKVLIAGRDGRSL